MASERQRSAKACENCRGRKRRCQPPHPCRFCRVRGLECVVREKARPRRLKYEDIPLLSMGPPDADSSPPCFPGGGDAIEIVTNCNGAASQDPLGIIVGLSQKLTLERYGYELQCHLVEPKQPAGKASLGMPSCQPSDAPVAHLTLDDIQQQLNSRKQSKNTFLGLVDMASLENVAISLFQPGPQPPNLGNIDLRATDVPLDQLAFLFATLALAPSEFPHIIDPQSLAFLHLSMSCVDDYAGKPTFDLALTLFLQHVCVLRAGTSNRSRSLIIQAVQVAHDLGINRGFSTKIPLQAPKFYLFLYFADQYCAMTYHTTSCIKPLDYSLDLFYPLIEEHPHLKVLIELLLLNGKVFYNLHSSSLTQENVFSLESAIGETCRRIGQVSPNSSDDGVLLEAQYQTLAQIHMFWSRIMLRTPLLLSPNHWLSSLAICLRASQMLLSTYFDILRPAIHVLVRSSATPGRDIKQQLREHLKLPPTWRQVHRITTSIFIILYGFWNGEVSPDEASHSCAVALLLLELQRIRWASSLNTITATLRSLAAISGLELRRALSDELPPDSEVYIDEITSAIHESLSGEGGLADGHSPDIDHTAATDQEPDLVFPEWDGDMDIFDSISPYASLSAFAWE